MKKIKATITAAIVIAALLATSMPVFAFSQNESRSVANFFIETQILKGDGSSYGFEKTPTRMEGVIILIRLLGKEAEAQQLQNLPCRFLDVPAWAIGYANYAYAENISKGVSDTLFGTNDLMTAQQYNTLLLRTIGYDDSQGDFRWNNAVDKAYDLEILAVDLAQQYESRTKYTKRDLMETSFSYLEAEFKGATGTLIGSLIDSGAVSGDLAEDYGLAVDKWDSITTNIDEDEYTTFDLDDDVIYVSGQTTDDNKKYILAMVKNKETDVKKTDKVVAADPNGEYDLALSLGSLSKGEYYVDLYANDERYNYYKSFILSSVIVKVTENDTFFITSPVYGQNLRIYKGNEVEEQDNALTLETRLSQLSTGTVKDLAAEITDGITGDYEKVQAIHDWVADNLYYDQDFFNGKTESTNIDTISVLKNRFAVCSGYANLTKDLISASGIPCKQVVGFALGITTEGGWEDVNLSTVSPNHVWNEAYVDGRWIIIDATWDSNNKYEGGKFTDGEAASRLYFDVSMQFLSNTHMSQDYEMN